MDEDDVLVAVHEIHHRLGGMTRTKINKLINTKADDKFYDKPPQTANSPPPHMHVGLQSKQQVSQQPLVHWRPLEFWDAEHGGAWTGAELPPLLLRHGHASEAQIDPQVPLQLSGSTTMQGLQR